MSSENFNPTGDKPGFFLTPEFISALSEEMRWSTYNNMIHRPSLYRHSRSVGAIGNHIYYFIIDEPDLADLVAIDTEGMMHDSPELFDNDEPSPLKDALSPEEKIKAAIQEMKGYERVGREYLRLEGERLEHFVAQGLQHQQKSSLTSQIVDVADKLDALGEVFHEIRCGNFEFLHPYEYYKSTKIPSFEKYPFWQQLKHDPAIELSKMPSLDDLIKMPQLKPDNLHSRETLKQDSYDPRLPAWYKSWLGIKFDLYKDTPQPEIHIFSGWKNELRKKWNLKSIQNDSV